MSTDVVLIGLDGLDPDLVQDWEEDLPTLRKYSRKGARGRVRSSDPPLSAPAWPWIYTGRQGGKHGCFGFTKRSEGSYEREPINYSDVRAESVWEAFDAAGISCGVVNVPFSYPPSDLDHGYVVAGWPVPNGQTIGSPSTTIDTIETITGEPYRVNPFPMGPRLGRLSPPDRLDRIVDGLWHHERAFEALARRTDVEVFCAVFMATDVAGHYLGWHPDRLRDLYIEQDRALGKLLDTFTDDTDVILVSDHGHAARSEWNFHVNEWLRQRGDLTLGEGSRIDPDGLLRRAGLTRGSLVRIADLVGIDDIRELTPESVFNAAKSIIPAADPSTSKVDLSRIEWPRTVAYAPEHNVIYLNTAQGHPSGVVRPEEAHHLRDDIAQGLRDLDHPSGEDGRLVSEVKTKEEIFEGRFTQVAPDIVFVADEMHCTVQTGFNDGEVFSDQRWSEHRQFGTLITAGPSFTSMGTVEQGHILDVFPLLLSLLDVPLPEDLDGNIPTSRVDYTMDPAYREPRRSDDPTRKYTAEERSEIEEQLGGLGYL